MNTPYLHTLIKNFNNDNLESFLREKSDNIEFPKEELYVNNEKFTNYDNAVLLAKSDLPDGILVVCTLQVTKDLTERSSKKEQYELAKNILKSSNSDAGIFVFYDDNSNFRFSLVYAEYQGNKRTWNNFKRFTYFVSPHQTNKTFLDQIGKADFSTIELLKEAFSVEKITNEFFAAYRYALNEIIIKALDSNVEYRIRHSFAQQLLSRILFIYFLQRKGWFKWKDYKQDKNYIKNLWSVYKSKSKTKDTFYSQWLGSLFFGAFNKKIHFINNDLPDDIKESFNLMPFLNGGLFSKNKLDELNFDLPDNIFEWLFEPDNEGSNKFKGFLEIFNFTIDESSPYDVEVAVDPEMLGKVYESLINEGERGDSGIFYTPRVEIDFMCRFSLVNYLASKTQISKQDLIELIFNHDSISDYPNIENLIAIRNNLYKAKIVDPAAGSASFLVGMMNVLVELHSALTKKIENKEENLFALKHRIILENLYGVDVKDWAVMVGELRLWLSLIIETDEKYMDIYTKPLLPNLSFKIRQGDSLVEEVGGIFINLRGNILKTLPNSIKQKISEIIDKKNQFFSGNRSADLREQYEIENLEKEIFIKILQERINNISNKITAKTKSLQTIANEKNIFGEKNSGTTEEQKKLADDIEQLRRELNTYQSALSAIRTKGKKDYFIWELDFAEVFVTNGGFDIVIGNPPYVRQEIIAPPLENEKDYSADDWRKLKGQYKDKLILATQNIWPNIKKIDKKSDLYIFFYYQGLSLLNDNGIFCFINSNSWLDVGYGTGLQEFLIKNMKPLYIIDNIAKRSFKQADVNTVIVFIQKPKVKPDDFTLKFIAFKKPFEEVITPEVLKDIENTTKPVFDHPMYRVYPKTKQELLEEGVEYPDDTELDLNQNPEQLHYIGNKWGGKYLRAPEIYFKILEKGKDKLVRLGDIAEVKRGFTTGANEFFYLKPVGMTVKEVVEIAEKNPDTLISVKNGAGWDGEIEAEFLKPVIKSPRELKTIMVKIEDLNYLVFMCHKNKNELKGTKTLEYIEWGERQDYNQRPTFKSRNLWWDLEEYASPFLWWVNIGDRYILFYNKEEALSDKMFYNLWPKTNNLFSFIVTFNCILVRLNAEIWGQEMTGSITVLTHTIEMMQNIEVLSPDILHSYVCKKINIEREINNIFTELGFDKTRPIREQEPNPLPDRKELDDIVFDALGLTEEERKEVYWAVAELVKARLDKAKSV